MDDGQQLRAEFSNRQRANVLGIQPQCFGVESFLRRGGGLFEVHYGIRSIDALQRKSFDELLASHLLAIVFGRPAEQA